MTLVDYIAVERAEPAMLEALGKGLAEGARLAGVSIAGGEIAEMRDVIAGAVPGAGFDLAGTAVGRVDLDAVNVGAAVRPGTASSASPAAASTATASRWPGASSSRARASA